MSRHREGSGSGLSALVTGSARGRWHCNGYKWLTRFALMGRHGINERLRSGFGLESNCLCGKRDFLWHPFWWGRSFGERTAGQDQPHSEWGMTCQWWKSKMDKIHFSLHSGKDQGLLQRSRQISDVVKERFSQITDLRVLSALCTYWDLS